MAIQNLQFRTSVATGTKQRASTGEGLAKLVMAGLNTYGTIKKVDNIQNKLSEAEQAKLDRETDSQEQITYLSQKNKLEKSWYESGMDEKTSIEQNKWIEDNQNSDSFINQEGKYKLYYDDAINGYKGKVSSTLKKEHKSLALRQYTTDISSNNLSVHDKDGLNKDGESIGLNKLLSSVNELDKDVSKDMVYRAGLSNTSLNMRRDFIDGKLVGKTNDEILAIYGGETFKSIKNKNSKEYLDFEELLVLN
jgi:hypothetical protein